MSRGVPRKAPRWSIPARTGPMAATMAKAHCTASRRRGQGRLGAKPSTYPLFLSYSLFYYAPASLYLGRICCLILCFVSCRAFVLRIVSHSIPCVLCAYDHHSPLWYLYFPIFLVLLPYSFLLPSCVGVRTLPARPCDPVRCCRPPSQR